MDSGVYVLHFCTECGRNIMTSHPVWYADSLRDWSVGLANAWSGCLRERMFLRTE